LIVRCQNSGSRVRTLTRRSTAVFVDMPHPHLQGPTLTGMGKVSIRTLNEASGFRAESASG
jgi:hypothetical protein